VTEDIRIPMASLNGDIDYDDEEESSAKSSMTNGSNQVISCLYFNPFYCTNHVLKTK